MDLTFNETKQGLGNLLSIVDEEINKNAKTFEEILKQRLGNISLPEAYMLHKEAGINFICEDGYVTGVFEGTIGIMPNKEFEKAVKAMEESRGINYGKRHACI